MRSSWRLDGEPVAAIVTTVVWRANFERALSTALAPFAGKVSGNPAGHGVIVSWFEFQHARPCAHVRRRADRLRRGPRIRRAHQRQEDLIDNFADGCLRQRARRSSAFHRRARSAGSGTIRGVRRSAAMSPRRAIARARMGCMTSGWRSRPQLRPHLRRAGLPVHQVLLHARTTGLMVLGGARSGLSAQRRQISSRTLPRSGATIRFCARCRPSAAVARCGAARPDADAAPAGWCPPVWRHLPASVQNSRAQPVPPRQRQDRVLQQGALAPSICQLYPASVKMHNASY